MTGDLCTLRDLKSWLSLGKVTEPHTLAASVTVAQAGAFQADDFVSVGGVLFTNVTPASPGQGQYKAAAGVYTFNALDSGKAAVIVYVMVHQDDGLLTRLITAASEDIRQEASRSFDPADYDEFYDGYGWGHTEIVTRQWPIISVTSLTIAGRAIPPQPGEGQPGYTFTNSDSAAHVAVHCMEFPPKKDAIELKYKAGYADINGLFLCPPDLVQAGIDLVAYRYVSKGHTGQNRKTLAGETVDYITDHYPDPVMRVIQRYQRKIPA